MTELMTIKTALRDFRTALTAGIDGFVKAGEIYVQAVDDNSRNADLFRDEFKDLVPCKTWGMLEQIGRKNMHPRLMLGGMADAKKNAAVKRLPFSTQERVFNRERFQFLTASGDTLELDMMEATADQVQQLCDGSTIRNLSAQKAYLTAMAVDKTELPEIKPPWSPCSGGVVINKAGRYTRQELKRMLQES